MVNKNDTNDWRKKTFGYLAEDTYIPHSAKIHAKGTQVTVICEIALSKKKRLTIDLPNASALCLSSSVKMWEQAEKIREEAKIDKTRLNKVNFPSDKSSYDYLECVMSSVIMAFTSIEVFVNETIPQDYIYTKKEKEGGEKKYTKKEIERSISIDDKLTNILPNIFRCQSPKGIGKWADYVQLRRIRNRIIHMKSNDVKSTTHLDKVLWDRLFLFKAPHKKAAGIIEFFLKQSDSEIPRWFEKYSNSDFC